MTYLLLLVFASSLIAKSKEKTSVYYMYSLEISDGSFSYCKAANNGACRRYIDIADFEASRAVI